METPLPGRENLLDSKVEHWKPPTYPRGEALVDRARNTILRWLDLQSGTIWSDLKNVLPQVEGTALDVGCGLQPFRHLFSDRCRYLAIDYADTKDDFGVKAPDTTYYSGDVWPVDNEVADFILSTETLEHVKKPVIFASELFRCLKPGGQALLTVPFAVRWHFIPYDYWRPTPSGIAELFASAGFKKIRVLGRGNELTVACYKGMQFIFALLAPQNASFLRRLGCRVLGLLSLPFLGVLTLAANLSLAWPGRVDFLGFTILLQKDAA